jgi:hypothetical protein
LSLWKGNYIYCVKIFSQLTVKILIFDRIKHTEAQAKEFINKFKYKILGVNYILSFVSALSASVISLIVTFPFDLAYSRYTAQINNDNNYKRMKDCFHSTSLTPETNQFDRRRAKYFNGFTISLYQSALFSTITLLGYQAMPSIPYFQSYGESQFRKSLKTFTGTSIIALMASIVSYPFDTIKRQVQVNGAKGYKLVYKNNSSEPIKLLIANPFSFYKGFTFHLGRTIPMTFIQYQIFLILAKFLKKPDPIKKGEVKINP